MTLPLRPNLGRAQARRPRLEALAPLLLPGLVLLVFGTGLRHQFTNWDDQQYITGNPLIRGLTWDHVARAFSGFHVFNYNPLHLVSYMVDYELWGLEAGGFFLTNLLLHAATGILVFRLARLWLRSAAAALFVAAIFVVHPTRVEPVAWLSARKDLLSGLFAIAAVLVYERHLAAGGGALSVPRGAWRAYCGALGLYLLALLSKSQLVTLPLVLLAMDLAARRPWLRALALKVPFLILSALFAYISVEAHAGESLRGLSFPDSVLEPLSALPRYLAHWLWPFGLSPYYDDTERGAPGAASVALGAAILAASAAAAWRSWRGQGRWLVALAWFYALLLPVSGIVRLNILVADRYLYLACLGPLAAAAGTLLELRPNRRLLAGAAAAAVLVCAGASGLYVQAFATSESLWRHVLASQPGCSIAHSNLGHHLLGQGRIEEARWHYDADLARRPYFETSFLGRALIHEEAGEHEGAARMYALAIEKRPQSAAIRLQAADYLERRGDPRAALELLLGLEPESATAAHQQRIAELRAKLGRDLRPSPSSAPAGRRAPPAPGE